MAHSLVRRKATCTSCCSRRLQYNFRQQLSKVRGATCGSSRSTKTPQIKSLFGSLFLVVLVTHGLHRHSPLRTNQRVNIAYILVSSFAPHLDLNPLPLDPGDPEVCAHQREREKEGKKTRRKGTQGSDRLGIPDPTPVVDGTKP